MGTSRGRVAALWCELGQALTRHRGTISQRELGRRLGYQRTSISHIEHGRHAPREFWASADEACSAGGALLAEYDRAIQAEQRAAEEDEVKRRELLALGPAALGLPLADKLEQARRGIDDVLGDATRRDADEWARVVDGYAHQVGCMPPSRTLPALASDFSELHDRIATASGTVRTRMIDSAAHLAALTAATFVFLRQHHTAQRWWRTATRAATTVGKPSLTAKVIGKQAVLSLYSIPPKHVLALADQAVAMGGNRPGPGVLSGLSARTQALARMGRHEEAQAALHELTDVFEALPDDEDVRDRRNTWNWAEQRLRFVESEAHTCAGRAKAAFAAQEAALALYPSTNWVGPMQVHSHRAIAMVRAGDVIGGLAHLDVVLRGLAPWQRADGLVQRSAAQALATVPRAHLHRAQGVRALLPSGS